MEQNNVKDTRTKFTCRKCRLRREEVVGKDIENQILYMSAEFCEMVCDKFAEHVVRLQFVLTDRIRWIDNADTIEVVRKDCIELVRTMSFALGNRYAGKIDRSKRRAE